MRFNNMKKASELFSDEARKAVSEAVTKAERKTSGEIVPVVATVSGRYDRAEDIFGLLTALVAVAAAWLVCPAEAGGSWTRGVMTHMPLHWILIIFVLGFIVGAVAATVFPVLRLPFIPKPEMRDEVERRAAEAFQQHRVRGTAGATGILIYVSLYERMARVMGDDAIAEKLDQSSWEEVLALVTDGMKKGEPERGLVNAIEKCGDLLARHFPIEPGDRDELSNDLRIVD